MLVKKSKIKPIFLITPLLFSPTTERVLHEPVLSERSGRPQAVLALPTHRRLHNIWHQSYKYPFLPFTFPPKCPADELSSIGSPAANDPGLLALPLTMEEHLGF